MGLLELIIWVSTPLCTAMHGLWNGGADPHQSWICPETFSQNFQYYCHHEGTRIGLWHMVVYRH